ncbi:hypothetical protein [Glycomyces buryatensis]|nr:hypothetical protein [Glycomyces buryatensis]
MSLADELISVLRGVLDQIDTHGSRLHVGLDLTDPKVTIRALRRTD